MDPNELRKLADFLRHALGLTSQGGLVEQSADEIERLRADLARMTDAASLLSGRVGRAEVWSNSKQAYVWGTRCHKCGGTYADVWCCSTAMGGS